MMVNRHQSNDDGPGYHTDPIYRAAILRYLFSLALACLIASIHAGPVMLAVWVAVAYVLTRGGTEDGGPTQKQSCNRNKGRPR
ncbi:hypothetical protein [Lignipirellula cremea]|uniref:Uncharacterized protein n=1 Tax=Lignipirellula cremea TaxID=2528010 RepID=A0A518DWL6_9BACT|nr:hypothetical protein [Lignipirellula cremea]QDU96236.1 hypothetical protein Pla8534_40550 [Lignipirellula cremea]